MRKIYFPFFLALLLIAIPTKAASSTIFLAEYKISYGAESISAQILDDSHQLPRYESEIESIRFINADGSHYIGDSVDVESIGFNGDERFVEFFFPAWAPTTGYFEVETEEVTFYTEYDMTNFLITSSLNLIPGQEIIIAGHNLNEDANLYIDNKKIDSDIYNDILTFTVPLGLKGGTAKLQLKNPYSNMIDVYVAPSLYNDPEQELLLPWYLSYIYEAHEIYSPKSQVTVAIIDSGIDLNHPDLQNNIWINSDEIPGNSRDDDNNGYVDDVYGWTYRLGSSGYIIDPSDSHGTGVAGLIAAQSNNNTGIIGISSNTKLMSLDVTDSSGSIPKQYVYDAIRYAADNGADIINLSLGGKAYNTFSQAYTDSIEYAYKKGALIVVAAGNGTSNQLGGDGINLNVIPGSPICNDGSHDMVLGVGSVDGGLNLSSFSNYGTNCVDVLALGEDVYTTTWASNGYYELMSGTSFAAPIVSGIAAMIKGEYPQLENWQIQYLIEQSGSNISGVSTKAGPFVDAYNSMVYANNIDYPSRPSILSGNSTSTNVFPDVPSSHSNNNAIQYLYNEGIVGGYPDGTFKPSNTVNRAELLKILIAGMEVDLDAGGYANCFPDVKDEWFAKYVCYAKEQEWIGGYPDGTFRPADTVNKVEALKMLLNA